MWGASARKPRLGLWREVACMVALGALLLSATGCPPVPPPGEGEGEGEGEPPTFAPGLEIVVEEVTIPADLRPEVQFRIQDEDGNPVPLSELTDARFILAYLGETEEGVTERFMSYTTRIEDPDGTPSSGDEALQATYDGAQLGGITPNNDGTYTYKFNTAVPDDYMADATHQLGGQFVREYFVTEEEYVDNPIFTFVPNGSPVVNDREIVLTETCNDCHTNLTAHGERHEVPLCILCHNTQTSDAQSGNSVDMPVMIHKIHYGANLPSVQQGDPYFIVGFRNTVHDYSEVHYPQPAQNCTSCHDDAAQADFWMTAPTMAGCASCHDRTWFGSPAATPDGFENHPVPQANDSLCNQCHTPENIEEVHTLPTETAQAVGLDLTITDVMTAEVEGGLQVSVDFTAVDGDDEPYATLESLNSVSMNVAWPADEIQDYLREAVAPTPAGMLTNNGGGSYTYTFAGLVPVEMGMDYAVGMEGRLRFMLDGATITQGLEDPSVTYFEADGTIIAGMARRMVVSNEQCAACHGGTIRAHGEQRIGVEYCVFCHNVNETDISRRPDDALPPVTVNFKEMIHKIHRGHDLVSGYTVYGFGGTTHDFTEVGFPGDESKCTICHKDGTYDLPLPSEAVSTVVAVDDMIVSETLPESAACTSCHDSAMTAVHAALNSDFGTGAESCAVCHGASAAFSVEEVHGLAE